MIVYQEQVMAIAQKSAGYSLGQADLLRRAMGKKKKAVLDKEFVPFSEGMRERGYSNSAIKTLWEILVPFADYAFNKAHTAGYGLMSYWTAFLKANYPAEYMAALLTSVREDKDKSALYLHECRRMGIKVLPPDVNDSDANYTPRGSDIRFGLAAIRNVGHNVVARSCGAAQQGSVRRLLRLPGQGRPSRVQQAGHRVTGQGGGLRLARSHPSRLDRGARRGGRPVLRPSARRPSASSICSGALRTPRRRDSRGAHHPGRRVGKTILLRMSARCSGSTSPTIRCFGVEHVLAANVDCSVAELMADGERPDGAS